MIQIPDTGFSEDFKEVLPETRLGILAGRVKVMPSTPEILQFIESVSSRLSEKLTLNEISTINIIHQTRQAYKKLGQDPSRYRPSAEALYRRIINGKELYRVNNIVDILNCISIKSGFSIGGYDLDKIEWEIKLGIGKENEPYEAIGRGKLNIHLLPVLRDKNGPFGSPTSDSIRTMVVPETKTFMMVFFDFEGSGNIEEILNKSAEYYDQYASVTDITIKVVP
jgi:DNA/RNA-binding domain of Phe-tRNA-synthetase-like protein